MLDSLFEDAPEKDKKPKLIKCPHCGEMFEP
jgi:DNA-directed RNA polymerase subunit RPC12/RpoP